MRAAFVTIYFLAGLGAAFGTAIRAVECGQKPVTWRTAVTAVLLWPTIVTLVIVSGDVCSARPSPAREG